MPFQQRWRATASIPNGQEKLIRHDESKNKIDENHGSKRGEHENEENDTDDSGIPVEIFTDSTTDSGEHLIRSRFSELGWHMLNSSKF